MNYKEHNEEVKQVWKSYHEGNPIRVPTTLGVASRFFMMNPRFNPENVSFEEYMKNPDLMFKMQAQFDRDKRYHIFGDHMMGPPEEEGGWSISVDFQNCYDAAWFGSEIKFPQNQCPYPVPFLNEDNKEMLFEKGLPDPFGGFCGMARDYYERFLELQKDFVLDGYPVAKIAIPFTCTDGPFTVTCDLFGAAQACVLLLEEPEFMHQFLNYISDAIIMRIKAWRNYLGEPELSKSFGMCDDSIMLLSLDTYKEFILPCHKKILNSVSTMEEPGLIHLCGDATRHFKTISEEMYIRSFDTGYPVKHGALAKELGPDIEIYGGPTADFLQRANREQILQESKRILEEVRPYTKKFILREGNNVVPGTPLENLKALRDAAILYGTY